MWHQEGGDHGVERAVLERQRPGVTVLEAHLRMQARGELEHLGREVDADDVAAALGHSGGGVAGPSGDIEDRGARGHRGGVEQGGDRPRGDQPEPVVIGSGAAVAPAGVLIRTERVAVHGATISAGRASRENDRVLAFLGISLMVIMTPGQDTALTIRNTLVGGRGNGLRTALGVACGQLVWALAASTGLAALLAASEPAFDAIRLAGAAYLILLGAHALRDAIRGSAKAVAPAAGRGREPASGRGS